MKKPTEPVFTPDTDIERRETSLRYFRYGQVSDIVLALGVQKGPILIRKAFVNLEKIRGDKTEFPAELSVHREWMGRCLVGTAENLLFYAEQASSLAYRHLRKKKRKK